MKDEADHKTLDWVGDMMIKLIDFDKRIGLADFELTIESNQYFTCHAIVKLGDFLNNDHIIMPYAWFNANESEVNKPEWFKRKELFDLNNVFERDFKKFVECQFQKMRHTTILRICVFIKWMRSFINTMDLDGVK